MNNKDAGHPEAPRMNKIQKAIAAVGLTALLVSILFPPWTNTLTNSHDGFRFINTETGRHEWAQINVELLAIEIVTIALATWLLILIFKRNRPD